jgi:nucleoside-diphosphate-sugar epimerase
VTILRLPATHGPGDPQRRMFGFAKRFEDKRPAILLDRLEANWRWSKCYVENAAHAIALATTDSRAAGRTYNVADQPIPTQLQWAQRVAAVARFEGRVLSVPGDRLPESMRCTIDTAQQYAMDTSRIERELGYKPLVPVDEGIRRTLVWERSHPPQTVKPEDFDYAAEDRALAAVGLC